MLNETFSLRRATLLARAGEVNQYLGKLVFLFFQVRYCFLLFMFALRKLYGDQARFYEAEQLPILKHTKPGIVSMVNVGNNM